jgi:zinc protease
VGVFIPSKDEVRVKNIEYTDDQIATLTKDYKGKLWKKKQLLSKPVSKI